MDTTNPAMQLASDYLATTNTVVFLTGKAGTGKTTFLQNLRQTSKKKLAIAAPTGVAAINAGGMTIHSLFQLPFGPLLPNNSNRPEVSYSDEKKALLSSLELLVIDEISMVRPDVLDQIDLILQSIKDNAHPFGGVQLLLIGDLSQLSPIVRDDEWVMLRPYYNTAYFFSSLVLQKAPFVRIELNKVFRQKEQAFVDILNEVRSQAVTRQSLDLLNQRYVPNFKPSADDPYITLTTRNSLSQQINTEFLEALNTEEMFYKATIRGEFPKDAYPTDPELLLKVGAQVMFVKNDSSAEKRYYNGKIGTVIKLKPDTVTVQCGSLEIDVQALEWANVKYQMTGEDINETNAGSFAQIPLKLAWAITIHKSQGLTFDKAIIDVSEAFTHGQAYVALSRCRSLAGMVLRNPVTANNIITDPAVAAFNARAKLLQPDSEQLAQDQERYRLFLLTELFNFNGLEKRAEDFQYLVPDLQPTVLDISRRSAGQLAGYDVDRIKKAAAYFANKLSAMTEHLHTHLSAYIGNSKTAAAKADALINWMMARLALLEHFATHNFTAAAYEALQQQKTKASGYLKQLNALPNEELYQQILSWRDARANAEKVIPNMVLSEKTAAAIAEKLPATLKALATIKGMGPQKAAQYGVDLIELIRAYQNHPGQADQVSMF